MALVHDLLDRNKAMVARRAPWMSYFQQLADVLLPTQAFFTKAQTPGVQVGTNIYDGTPRLALRSLATTIDGLIKPKSNMWFDVEVDDPDVMEQDDAKLWLETVRDRMWHHLYRKDARFIQRSGEVDLSLTCFGYGVLWIDENHLRNGLMFRSFHNSRVAFDEDVEGNIDSLSISEPMTPRQALMFYQRYGKKPEDIPQKIKDALASKMTSEKKFEFIQLVLPQEDHQAGAIGEQGFPFKSVCIDVENEKIVKQQGFYEFPAAIPRWETAPGELYPRSPGAMALPDSQTLQAMGKTLLIGGQRAVDPPIWMQNDAIVSPVRTFPGGVTIMDVADIQGQPVGAFPVATNLPIGREMQADYRGMVEAAFFKNVFNLPIESRDMTATEIIARKEEFIRVIGPVFGRLESDYIGHIAERTFGIMDRAGAFPKRPDILQNAKVQFRFQSPIQKARKQMEIAALGQSLQFIAPLAEVQPEIMDNFDGDAITRDAREWAGLPNKWMRPKNKVDELRAARQQGLAQQQGLADSGPITEALVNVAQADNLLRP